MIVFTQIKTILLENTISHWMTALAIGAAVFFAIFIVTGFLAQRDRLMPAPVGEHWDRVLSILIRRTHRLFMFFIALFAASLALSLPFESGLLVRMLIIAMLAQSILWSNGIINYLTGAFTETHMEKDAAAVTTMTALGVLMKIVIFIVAVLMILANLGVHIGALLAGFGIAGVAVGLAAQHVLADLFASLSIVLDKPFVIGDFIIVGDKMGTVQHIGLKTTRLRSLSGEQLIFPNNDLLQSRIQNYKRMEERRIVFGFGVIYQTTQEQLQAIPPMVREIIESRDKTRFDRAHFKAYGACSLDFEVVYYVLSPDYNIYMDIQQAINLAIFSLFAREGIQFAYPTQSLYIVSNQPENQPTA